MKQLIRCVALVAVSLTLANRAPGQPQQPRLDQSGRSYIRTTGDATVSAKPDRARLTIGVTTQAATAQAAGGQNATQTDAMMAALRSTLGASADLRTSGKY